MCAQYDNNSGGREETASSYRRVFQVPREGVAARLREESFRNRPNAAFFRNLLGLRRASLARPGGGGWAYVFLASAPN